MADSQTRNPRGRRLRIGDLLVAAGELSDAQLQTALAEQKRSGRKLGRILVDLDFIDEDQFLRFLSKQLEVQFIDLKNFNFRSDLVTLLPETLARRYRAIVLEEADAGLLVGMADPMDIFGYDEIARSVGVPIDIAVVRENELLAALDQNYRRTNEIASFAEQLEDELATDDFVPAGIGGGSDDANATPVARMLQSILEDAIQMRASDVHIEPDEAVLRIRQRVDGVLQEQIIKETRIASALVSRLKLISGLDISERRLPQDGRFQTRIKGTDVDVRISTMPIITGESVVLRLLHQSAGLSTLEQVGMPEHLLRRFRRLFRRPNGLLLVTGPTGSGKTTTLYGALNELNDPHKKIITVEDPVEFQLERVSQVQINPKIGLHFSTVLRSTLRQDPDILLVGEIRDQETAEIALRAAMTGHLVMSTLHTNDAISTAMRLLDIGVEGYLAAAALRGIVAQRLVRRVCEGCARADNIGPNERAWLGGLLSPEELQSAAFRRGAGCSRCHSTGYRGRVGVFELLELDLDMADALRRNDTESFSRLCRVAQANETLVDNALRYARDGLTSIAEVMHLAGELEDSEPLDAEPAEELAIPPAVDAPQGLTVDPPASGLGRDSVTRH